MVYAGAHAGFRWSTWDESPIYYVRPACAYPLAGSAPGGAPRPTPADSVNVYLPPNPSPYQSVVAPNPIHHSRGGFEPGLDVGVRLLPLGPPLPGGRRTVHPGDGGQARSAADEARGTWRARLVLAAGLA